MNALELVQQVEAYQDESDPTVTDIWRVSDLNSADWALMRLSECQEEAAEIQRQAEAAIERVRARAQALIEKARRGESFFRMKLEDFAQTHRDLVLTGKKRSREFVHGRVGFRKKAERLVVEDKEALAAWLLTRPVEEGLYRYKVEPEMRALQEAFRRDGVLPPGCAIEIETESIVIEAEAPEGALAKGKP